LRDIVFKEKLAEFVDWFRFDILGESPHRKLPKNILAQIPNQWILACGVLTKQNHNQL